MPSPFPRSTETLFPYVLAATRSGWPSPLKSPTATEWGDSPRRGRSLLTRDVRTLYLGAVPNRFQAEAVDVRNTGDSMDMINEQILESAKNRLVEDFHPHKVILFGSHARGTADPHSDVDILVVCPIKGSRRALMTAMDRALRGMGFARDIVVLSPEEFEKDRHIPGTVARPASLEGKVLYERQ